MLISRKAVDVFKPALSFVFILDGCVKLEIESSSLFDCIEFPLDIIECCWNRLFLKKSHSLMLPQQPPQLLPIKGVCFFIGRVTYVFIVNGICDCFPFGIFFIEPRF